MTPHRQSSGPSNGGRKRPTSFRLSEGFLKRLGYLADTNGLSLAGEIELILRNVDASESCSTKEVRKIVDREREESSPMAPVGIRLSSAALRKLKEAAEASGVSQSEALECSVISAYRYKTGGYEV